MAARSNSETRPLGLSCGLAEFLGEFFCASVSFDIKTIQVRHKDNPSNYVKTQAVASVVD